MNIFIVSLQLCAKAEIKNQKILWRSKRKKGVLEFSVPFSTSACLLCTHSLHPFRHSRSTLNHKEQQMMLMFHCLFSFTVYCMCLILYLSIGSGTDTDKFGKRALVLDQYSVLSDKLSCGIGIFTVPQIQ